MLTDLTEVIELREALALKKNLESLGEMSAGLAHELKNSLAALHGYAQLLQTPLLSAKENQTAATALLQEVRSLSEMVTAFLNFASPRPLNLSPTWLREVVDDCAEDLTPLIKDKRVELSITGDFPAVSVDDRMLRQALINLLRNAAEAIDAEQPERRVVVKGSLSKRSARQSVGVG
ncbi:MAG: histidine kinase dimerization/phospho-acceptor domain-containing protein [Pyrinomonadaceae bacterium]